MGACKSIVSHGPLPLFPTPNDSTRNVTVDDEAPEGAGGS